MYDWPEVRPRTDAFWESLREALSARGIAAPARLSRPADLSQPWADPALLLGQTCGLPYVSGHCGGAVLVGRPVYDAPGTGDGFYCSALVARADGPEDLAEFVGSRAAVNDPGSQSGCNALADAVLCAVPAADAPLFAEVRFSGSHRASALMVAGGDAEIAAIDAVSWALFQEFETEAHGRLKVLGWTRRMPALPFIAGARTAPRKAALFEALAEAIAGSPRVPGLPVALAPAADRDYDPVRDMAARLKGLRLAPALEPLGA